MLGFTRHLREIKVCCFLLFLFFRHAHRSNGSTDFDNLHLNRRGLTQDAFGALEKYFNQVAIPSPKFLEGIFNANRKSRMIFQR
jgi:hypothetical protein